MARKGNPIAVRLAKNRSPDSSWFSDYYYGKLVYQDVNMRSYFGSIRPPTISTFGFRLGRCLLLHFPKGTFIHCFLPLPRGRGQKQREPGKEKGPWWAFGKVGPIGCLRKGTEEARTDVRGRGAFGGAEGGGSPREKQNEIRVWPKKMQRYGYHGPSRKKNPSKSKALRVSGASAHPKYAGLVNYRDFLIENDDSLRKTKLFKFFLPGIKIKKSRSDGPKTHPQKRTLPEVRPSLNYSVMQYWSNTKNKMNFDPVVVLKHFVAPGLSEPSRIRGAKRGHRRIAFFVESLTSEKKCLAQRHKIAGTTKTTISLFPFFGATLVFLREGAITTRQGRVQLWSQLSQKCWNLMGKDKVMELIEKCRELGSTGSLIKGIEMMIEIILRNRRIPYGYNSYWNEVKKKLSFLSERTKTETSIESVKIKSVYQSASLIAQDISLKLRRRSFRSIFSHIVKDLSYRRTKGVEGIRICCSGRLKGAAKSRTECGKFGKTSCNEWAQKIDYASAEVSTRYGILGVKVWISYR